jgi:metal transporter CNNM
MRQKVLIFFISGGEPTHALSLIDMIMGPMSAASGRSMLASVLLLVVLVLLLQPQGIVAIRRGGEIKERVAQAIEILQKSGNACEPVERIIETLNSLLQEDDSINRRLEDGKDAQDDDDYYSLYGYYNGHSNSDVSVSYDDEDNTIVTVGDEVIVVVEYELGHYIFNGMMVLTCICLGATMAGLLMGIMSLDPLILGVKARTAATEVERQRAMALLPFVQNKNLVLVSVLLVNCGTNEALPIFMDALLDNPLLTVILALTVVLVVGEILPSAYFTGKDQIKSASDLIPVLRFVIIMTSPISYPLAKLMDHYFHHSPEVSAFKRGEISAMVRIQYEEHLAWKRRQAEKTEKATMQDDISMAPSQRLRNQCDPCLAASNLCEPLSFMSDMQFSACLPHDQCLQSAQSANSMHQNIGRDDIIKLEGALSMKDKKVLRAYTPMNRVVSVSSDTVLDEETIVRIYSYGYSRIPVFARDESTGMLGVCGVLLTKQLMLVRKEDKRQVSHLTFYEPPCVSPETSLAETLNIILGGNRKSSNMALVCAHPELANAALRRRQPVPVEAGVMGIITLGNTLEELIQEQIWDEKDKRCDQNLKRARWAVGKWKVFVQRKRMQREDANSVSSSDDDDANPFDYVKMKEIV